MRKHGANTKKANISLRMAGLGIFFIILCLSFSTVLFVFQYRGWKNPPAPDGENIKKVTVSGLRGEIYDRNGKLLVGNSTSYDLIYEYGAMPNTYKEINAELLELHKAMKITGNSSNASADLFPLDGKYPEFSFSDKVNDNQSDIYFYLNRVLTDDHLGWNISAEELVEYFADKYKLSKELYTNEEIDVLLHFWYGMERVRFGAFQSYTVARSVNQDLINYIEESSIVGANFIANTKRVYKYPGVASHILGQVGKISAENAKYYSDLGYPMDAMVGRSGCEEAFESYLHGQDGVMVIKYDDDGNIIDKYYEVEPISGNDVYLTIDIDLQIAAEEGLADNIAAIGGSESGALTATDPRNGEILALASFPTYDLTRFESQEYINSLNANPENPWLNRALNGVYAPGSVYKIGVALAALEENAITTDTKFYCAKVYPHYHQPECLGYHYSINVIDAIEVSCNVFFYYVGEQMGLGSINRYTEALGLGKKTGIELSEKAGIIAGPQYSSNWKISDNLPGAIGQSDHGYTPLQLSVYMSTVVNGGTRYRAHLLDSVRTFYTGEVVYEEEPVIMSSLDFSDSTYGVLIEGMRQVVTGSTTLSNQFRGLPVTVGGKTGTAEVDGQEANALLSCFAPLNDPEIVVSCIIEEGVSGSRASVAVGRVLDAYFSKNNKE